MFALITRSGLKVLDSEVWVIGTEVVKVSSYLCPKKEVLQNFVLVKNEDLIPFKQSCNSLRSFNLVLQVVYAWIWIVLHTNFLKKQLIQTLSLLVYQRQMAFFFFILKSIFFTAGI